MGKSDANRTGIAWVEEAVWGLMPAAAATPLTELRFTGETFSYNVSHIESAEIRDDRQTTDLIQTGADPGGGFNFELSYGALDTVGMAGALWSDWSTAIASTRNDLIFDITGSIYAEWSSFASFVTGQWIEISGFTAAASLGNNDYYFITGRRATGIDVTPSPTVAIPTTVNGALWIKGCYIRNGVTEHSYTFERDHSDIAAPDTPYFDFKGMVCNTFAVTAAANAVLSGSIEYIGKTASTGTGSGNAGTNIESPTNDILNAVSNVGRIMEGATFGTIDSDLLIQEISFSINNNVRGLPAIGSLGNADIGVGGFEVTGSMNAYFNGLDLYDKFIASNESGFGFKVEDNDGNAYIFTFPRIKFETSPINASGKNTDVMQNLTWRAIRHATYDCMMQIDRFPA